MNYNFGWIEENSNIVSDDDIIKEVDNFFKSLQLRGLEYRQEQHNMALDIIKSILKKHHRVVEAGVGIGKTYAYLVPMVLMSKYRQKIILLSTSSISLEEQLEANLKNVLDMLNLNDKIKYTVLKGQRNYLCENKMQLLSVNEKNFLKKQYQKDKYVKREYNAENCVSKIRNACSFKNSCDYFKDYKKRDDSSIRIFICNHNFLISVLSKEAKMLDFDYVVCDEAHKLSDVLIDCKTKKLTLSENIEKISKYFSNNLDSRASSSYNNINAVYNSLIKKLEEEVLKAKSAVKIKLKEYDKLEFNYNTPEINSCAQILCNTINDLIKYRFAITSSEMEDMVSKIEEDILIFKSLANKNNRDYLLYANINDDKIDIYYMPQNTHDIANHLISINNKHKQFVFTSATLTTSLNDYHYFLNNLALEDSKIVDISNSYISPYDYENNMLIYLEKFIANPNRKWEYRKKVISKIKTLIQVTNGKALILFTSKGDLNYVYDNLKDKCGNIKILKQAQGSSQDSVIEEFKNNTNSVLLATNYWEGIDVQGVSLSHIIIARLPFPTVDAVTKNKEKIYGKRIYLNEMIIKAKQGIGRLIRSETDRGIISILDSRAEKRYLKELKNCFYKSRITSDIKDIENFAQENLIK